MTDLTVVGGVYLERCVQPLWDAVYGSAGRAIHAVRSLVEGKLTLVAYVPETLAGAAKYLADTAGAELRAVGAVEYVSFDYIHPLARPTIQPVPSKIAQNLPIRVEGGVVLRYGMLEGDAIVDAEVAVYDPQSAYGPQFFGENGSRAKRLAVVLNRAEAHALTGETDPLSAAQAIRSREGAEVVVLKMGGKGAMVVDRGGHNQVPLYRTERVFKLGSGDVFSATFAALWGVRGFGHVEAADLASRATAAYCSSRSLPVPQIDALRASSFAPLTPGAGLVYLAGPFFDLGQRWLVDEARATLKNLGAEVFSPVHEVGPGPASIVAPEDIAGLERSDVVFAILNGMDPGTIFEVGYAIKKGIPVVALAQNIKEEDLKMFAGTGCDISDDFVSAAYRAIWRLPS